MTEEGPPLCLQGGSILEPLSGLLGWAGVVLPVPALGTWIICPLKCILPVNANYTGHCTLGTWLTCGWAQQVAVDWPLALIRMPEQFIQEKNKPDLLLQA